MTKKFGIIGNPIEHSLSPTLHNYWFKKYKIDANYSIINVGADDLSKVVEKIRKKNLSGINITLPYKQKIVPFLDILINDAEFITYEFLCKYFSYVDPSCKFPKIIFIFFKYFLGNNSKFPILP